MRCVDATKSALCWKGVLAEGNMTLRRMAAGVLALLCAIPVFTQWGYVGVHFVDGSVAYLMFIIAPVALSALLLGTLPGTMAGLLTGTVLFAHSILWPLDYYELAYVTPVTSIVMTAVFGFVLGILLASGSQRARICRMLFVALACLVASCVYSLGCAQALGWQAGPSLIDVGTLAFQAGADALILILVCVVGLVLGEREMRKIREVGLRNVFCAWLLALVLVAFMVVEVASYGAITNNRFAQAAKRMCNEVVTVLDWVVRLSDLEGNVTESVEQAREKLFSGLFAGYSEDHDGLLIGMYNGSIIGVDDARVSPDLTLAENLGVEVEAAAERSVKEGTLERIVYLGPDATDDFIDFAIPGTEDELKFDSLYTLQVGYLFAMENNGYRVVLIRPASMVFNARDDVVGWVFVSSLVLLVCVLVLAQQLLGHLVARRIDETNEALACITAGDLEVRVKPSETREFQELSAGINTTVDALRGWIAEAESRMDAELAAAKAIQESALPSVFPPFPDIRRFDVFASMDAAREVGGDFYDFFLIGGDCDPDSGKLAFVMADVSGKGVPAALFMMRAKTQIHDCLAGGMELGEAMRRANLMLCEGNDAGMFATAWVGVLDYATAHVDFANAGHNPPLLWHKGSWQWLSEAPAMPLGLFDDEMYPTYSLDCEVGDKILLYTDGVTEAFSVDKEQYGEDRLLRQVQEGSALRPRELVERVRASVEAHAEGAEQSDDITILALEVDAV